MDVAICIATCDRPMELRRLLASIGRCERPGHVDLRIIIIDNPRQERLDADEGDLASIARAPVRLAREERRGIPYARNRAVREAMPAEWILFVDDDEVVDGAWLVEHYRAAEELDADVLAGPVLPIYPPGAPAWAQPSGVYERRRFATGHLLPTAATGNTLVRGSLFVDLDRWFDERLALTGGSDVEFFDRASRRGARICWVDSAIAMEEVATERLRLSWVLKRNYRIGLRQGRAKENQRRGRGIRRFARSVMLAAPALLPLMRRKPEAVKRAARAARLAGLAAADFGLEFDEYR